MGNAFEDAMHQGYSAEEMAADMAASEAEFIQEHGCCDCEFYSNGRWLSGCQGIRCDTSYKGGAHDWR